MLRAESLVLDRPVDDDEKLVDLERLLQVVARTELHGLDGAVDGGMRGHHHDLRTLGLRNGGGELPHQIEAGHIRHQVVEHDDVEGALGQSLPRLVSPTSLRHIVPFTPERRAERAPKLGLVVHEEDAAPRHRELRSGD